MTVANFNVVFGEKEEPLLEYFDSIIVPAFKMDLIRKTPNEEYSFFNIEIVEVEAGVYALTGIIVKSTTLEIKSKIDSNKQLIETNEAYKTAPYSSFIIYLKNHRMVLIKNQKGSPDLRSFAATVRYYLYRYVSDVNKARRKEHIELLPFAIVNIIGIPLENSIVQALGEVKNINKLHLRFYPLNGDLDFSNLFEGMATDLRKKVGSKNGSITLNSPKSIEGISQILTAAQGTVEPSFDVTFPDNKKGKISNGRISEDIQIDVVEEDIDRGIIEAIEKTKHLESIQYVSDGNNEIYRTRKAKIIPFVGRIQ